MSLVLFQILSLVLLIPTFFVSIYYLSLTLFALTLRNKDICDDLPNQGYNFAIVIPAHNEEDGIENTLISCASLDYPREKYQVYVVADNCTDHTAEIVRKTELAICLIRNDIQRQGKGFALEWVFDQILPKRYDAIVVLDADCSIDGQALRYFSRYLADGNAVLQASYMSCNPDDSPISYAIAIGNLIENRLFYWPKSDLGLAVFLRGTGMVFRSDILEIFPWDAYSIVEDVEYSIRLFRNGTRVRFVNEATVLSEFPVSGRQLGVQRKRWASGNLSFVKSQALKLIWQGLLNRQFLLIDAGWTFFTLSRPLLLLLSIFSLAIALFCELFIPWGLSKIVLSAAFAVVIIQSLYFGLGIFLLGITSDRIKLLFGAPNVVLRMLIISIFSFFTSNNEEWAKTPRKKR